MYRNIVIGLLLSGCIFSIVTSKENGTTSVTHASPTSAGPGAPTIPSATHLSKTEQSVTRSHPGTGREQTGARRQIEHPFSEPVIIIIIFLVMGGVIGVILLFAYGVGKLRMRNPVTAQPEFPQNTDDPLSSVETENPVLPQNNNE
ncbi:glycophorin-A [Phyllostomus hastatus]|uniref:glycophorin-A n=1 Tax=Phyllostomus hastatus TaxID=9423 RepID=UPI001E681B14|nr:glycophorin-A [Phyllostomus hastatus]